MALEGAYHQCHARCMKQRTLILTYLISANLILGRFPSDRLLQRPEASNLGPKFWPVCRAIVKGDIGALKTSLNGAHKTWFLDRGLYLPLRNRCEVLIWRTLARRTFLLTGVPGDERRAPSFSLYELMELAQVLEQRSKVAPSPNPGRLHTNYIFMTKPSSSTSITNTQEEEEEELDPDLEGAEEEDSDDDDNNNHAPDEQSPEHQRYKKPHRSSAP